MIWRIFKMITREEYLNKMKDLRDKYLEGYKNATDIQKADKIKKGSQLVADAPTLFGITADHLLDGASTQKAWGFINQTTDATKKADLSKKFQILFMLYDILIQLSYASKDLSFVLADYNNSSHAIFNIKYQNKGVVAVGVDANILKALLKSTLSPDKAPSIDAYAFGDSKDLARAIQTLGLSDKIPNYLELLLGIYETPTDTLLQGFQKGIKKAYSLLSVIYVHRDILSKITTEFGIDKSTDALKKYWNEDISILAQYKDLQAASQASKKPEPKPEPEVVVEQEEDEITRGLRQLAAGQMPDEDEEDFNLSNLNDLSRQFSESQKSQKQPESQTTKEQPKPDTTTQAKIDALKNQIESTKNLLATELANQKRITDELTKQKDIIEGERDRKSSEYIADISAKKQVTQELEKEPVVEPKKEPVVEPKKEPVVEPKKEPVVEPEKKPTQDQEIDRKVLGNLQLAYSSKYKSISDRFNFLVSVMNPQSPFKDLTYKQNFPVDSFRLQTLGQNLLNSKSKEDFVEYIAYIKRNFQRSASPNTPILKMESKAVEDVCKAMSDQLAQMFVQKGAGEDTRVAVFYSYTWGDGTGQNPHKVNALYKKDGTNNLEVVSLTLKPSAELRDILDKGATKTFEEKQELLRDLFNRNKQKGTSEISFTQTRPLVIGLPKTEPPKVEAKVEPPKTELSKVETTKTEVIKVETPEVDDYFEEEVSEEQTPNYFKVSGEDYNYEFKVLEACKVLASNKGETSLLEPEPKYPAYLQARTYYNQPTEMQKIVNIIANFDPNYILMGPDNIAVTTGAPIVVQDKKNPNQYFVLSGNGRTMALHRMYDRQRTSTPSQNLTKYKNILKNRLGIYGLPQNALQDIKEPILVRVMSGTEKWDDTKFTRFSAECNVSEAYAESQQNVASALARGLSDEILFAFGKIFAESELDDIDVFLSSSIQAPKMKKLLYDNNIFTDATIAPYWIASKTAFNDDFIDLFSAVILNKAVPRDALFNIDSLSNNKIKIKSISAYLVFLRISRNLTAWESYFKKLTDALRIVIKTYIAFQTYQYEAKNVKVAEYSPSNVNSVQKVFKNIQKWYNANTISFDMSEGNDFDWKVELTSNPNARSIFEAFCTTSTGKSLFTLLESTNEIAAGFPIFSSVESDTFDLFGDNENTPKDFYIYLDTAITKYINRNFKDDEPPKKPTRLQFTNSAYQIGITKSKQIPTQQPTSVQPKTQPQIDIKFKGTPSKFNIQQNQYSNVWGNAVNRYYCFVNQDVKNVYDRQAFDKGIYAFIHHLQAKDPMENADGEDITLGVYLQEMRNKYLTSGYMPTQYLGILKESMQGLESKTPPKFVEITDPLKITITKEDMDGQTDKYAFLHNIGQYIACRLEMYVAQSYILKNQPTQEGIGAEMSYTTQSIPSMDIDGQTTLESPDTTVKVVKTKVEPTLALEDTDETPEVSQKYYIKLQPCFEIPALIEVLVFERGEEDAFTGLMMSCADISNEILQDPQLLRVGNDLLLKNISTRVLGVIQKAFTDMVNTVLETGDVDVLNLKQIKDTKGLYESFKAFMSAIDPEGADSLEQKALAYKGEISEGMRKQTSFVKEATTPEGNIRFAEAQEIYPEMFAIYDQRTNNILQINGIVTYTERKLPSLVTVCDFMQLVNNSYFLHTETNLSEIENLAIIWRNTLTEGRKGKLTETLALEGIPLNDALKNTDYYEILKKDIQLSGDNKIAFASFLGLTANALVDCIKRLNKENPNNILLEKKKARYSEIKKDHPLLITLDKVLPKLLTKVETILQTLKDNNLKIVDENSPLMSRTVLHLELQKSGSVFTLKYGLYVIWNIEPTKVSMWQQIEDDFKRDIDLNCSILDIDYESQIPTMFKLGENFGGETKTQQKVFVLGYTGTSDKNNFDAKDICQYLFPLNDYFMCDLKDKVYEFRNLDGTCKTSKDYLMLPSSLEESYFPFNDIRTIQMNFKLDDFLSGLSKTSTNGETALFYNNMLFKYVEPKPEDSEDTNLDDYKKTLFANGYLAMNSDGVTTLVESIHTFDRMPIVYTIPDTSGEDDEEG